MTGAREDAFALARAVYGSSLRPRSLDELRARILAGDPAPIAGTKDVRELAELRGGVNGDDAASRRLLAAIAQQLGVQALLVVSRSRPAEPVGGDAGPDEATATVEADAGAASSSSPAPASARLFLAETGELDAARYEPDGSGGWRGTVSSLSGRFPPPPSVATAQVQGPPPKLVPKEEDKPFYRSPWLWGALGAAALVGAFFFFVSQDTGDDPIHLQMRVPR
jgi:hypothetical protein